MTRILKREKKGQVVVLNWRRSLERRLRVFVVLFDTMAAPKTKHVAVESLALREKKWAAAGRLFFFFARKYSSKKETRVKLKKKSLLWLRLILMQHLPSAQESGGLKFHPRRPDGVPKNNKRADGRAVVVIEKKKKNALCVKSRLLFCYPRADQITFALLFFFFGFRNSRNFASNQVENVPAEISI